MRHIIVIVMSLVLLTAGTALAVKPDNPGGGGDKFDAEAAILAEEEARIAADAILQGQIDAEEAARISGDAALQNQITAEEGARISGDAALQGQIDNILNNSTAPAPAVMYLRTKLSARPPTCPEYWTEANYAPIAIAAGGIEYYERTCYNMDNSCSVMYLRTRLSYPPPNCPEYWTEANYASIAVDIGVEYYERTCYYCAQ